MSLKEVHPDEFSYCHPLVLASENGHEKTVDSFLKVTAPTDLTKEALVKALENGHVRIAKKLISHGFVIPKEKLNELCNNACERGYVEIVQLLLQMKELDIETLGGFFLVIACKHFQLEVIKVLLNDKRSLKSLDSLAVLKDACREDFSGHVIELLLSIEGFIPNVAHHLTPACSANNVKAVELLLRNPFLQINNNPINLVVDNNTVEIFQKLLKDKRFDPSINENQTFILACQKIRRDILFILFADNRVYHSLTTMQLHSAMNALLENFQDDLRDVYEEIVQIIKSHPNWVET